MALSAFVVHAGEDPDQVLGVDQDAVRRRQSRADIITLPFQVLVDLPIKDARRLRHNAGCRLRAQRTAGGEQRAYQEG